MPSIDRQDQQDRTEDQDYDLQEAKNKLSHLKNV